MQYRVDGRKTMRVKIYRIMLCVVIGMCYMTGCNRQDDTNENLQKDMDTLVLEHEHGTEENVLEPAMYSDLDHLLSIGDTGRLNTAESDGKLTSTTITLEELYTGDEAEQIIWEYCQSGEAKYEYSDPKEGYTWQAIRYRTPESPKDLYINIKLEGLDGNKLTYDREEVSSRTHDIFYKMKKTEEGYDDLYCYYEVPEDCKEYMLECGIRRWDTSETACYKITR